MEHKPTFTDYLSILYKWKKFLIINLLVVTIIATAISFLIPKTYKATASIILAPQNSGGLGGLSGLLGGNSTLSLGAKLFGVASTDEDLVIGLLNSRTIIEKVVNKFDLFKYYNDDGERNFDKLMKKLTKDLFFDMNEYGMIEISVINKKPQVCADIANYFVKLADSLNIELGIINAKNNRIFVERRYQKNVNDLKLAEDSMYVFQKKYGIFAVPEQLEASVKFAAEIEGQLAQKEMTLHIVKQTSGENSPQYSELLSGVKILRNKINELKYSDKLSSTSNVLFPFKNAPDMVIKYFRLYRKIEIQSKIMEFTLPMYEQARFEEQKSIPTLLTIDKAFPPQLKYAPKKSLIILGFLFLTMFVMLPFIFIADRYHNRNSCKNPVQKMINNFVSKINSLYKMSF